VFKFKIKIENLGMKGYDEMEDNRVMRNQKAGVFDIIKKQASTIFSKNFIIFVFLTSLPLFFFMVYYEISLQRTLVDASNILKLSGPYSYSDWSILPAIPVKSTKDFRHELVRLGLLYLVPRHLLELCAIIVTVDLASKIHVEERVTTTLKEMMHRPIYGARMRGTFITSLYVLFFSTCTLSGLIFLVTSYFVVWRGSMFLGFFLVFYGPIFVALLAKYLEWSGVWNMSIVISVLEGTYGAEALLHSAYFSRGSERRGQLLVLVFFVWGQGLRLSSLYFGWYEGGSWGIAAQVGLWCLGNVLKWVVFILYFYDCKKRTLEKKVDVELGRVTKAVDVRKDTETE
jgi:hypothetical protein